MLDTENPWGPHVLSSSLYQACNLLCRHISDELSRIQSGELEMDQAQLLFSQDRVRRVVNYEWVPRMSYSDI